MKVVFEGELYSRIKGVWLDESFITVAKGLQRKLNGLYRDQRLKDLTGIQNDEILEEAKAFKNSYSPDLAIELLGYLYDNGFKINEVLPMMTSCYRAGNEPEKAVDLCKKAKLKYGNSILSPELLTSVAAAYLDLNEFENGKKCCDRAYAKSNGKASDELKNVYKRLHSEWHLPY